MTTQTSVIGKQDIEVAESPFVWHAQTTKLAQPESKVDWALVLGITPGRPNEALFGTHIREALRTLRNW